ncbi:hypothetical protein GC173_18890 [bacterium]|nr:hypothetical protein [bacterium]
MTGGMPPDVALRYLKAFRAEADLLLRAPEKIAPPIPRGYRCGATLTEDPAFDNRVVRAVYTNPDEAKVIVRRVTHDEQATLRQIDGRMAFLPASVPPCIVRVEDKSTTMAHWSPIWKRLRSVRISMAAPEPTTLGLDGVTYTLTTGGLFGGRIALTWWCDGPAEWMELIEAAQALGEWVDRHFDDSGSHSTLS